MNRVLVCPFGDVNLLITLGEKLRQARPQVHDVTYVCFTHYEREIYRACGLSHHFIPPGEADSGLLNADVKQVLGHTLALARKHLGAGHEARFAAAANHYARCLTEIIQKEGYEDVVLFNGQHNLFVAVLDHVVSQLGARKLVFEQGLFRPNYVTVDGRGVNWRNSIQSLDELLSPVPYAYQKTALYQDLVDSLPLRDGEPVDYKRHVSKLGLLTQYVKMKLQPSWRLFLRSADNRDLLESACFPIDRPIPQTNILTERLQSNAFDFVILCPLQVETDTQITLHSPQLSGMQELVNVVEQAVDAFNARSSRKACVIFKVHPMEPQTPIVSSPAACLVNESRISTILDTRCDLVITINSTAGIEAIERNKPVITLGNAFYSFPGVVHSHCARTDDLAACIQSGLLAPAHDRALQDRFIEALRTKYQVPLRARQVAAPITITPNVLESSPAGV